MALADVAESVGQTFDRLVDAFRISGEMNSVALVTPFAVLHSYCSLFHAKFLSHGISACNDDLSHAVRLPLDHWTRTREREAANRSKDKLVTHTHI